jgi:hypothetical protein
MLARAAGLLHEVDKRIRALITLAYAASMDETPLRVGPRTPRPGRKKAEKYLLVACTRLWTHYQLGDRDLDTFKASLPGLCAGRWTRPCRPRCGRRRGHDGHETAGQLPVAATGGGGQPRNVRRHRSGPKARRTRHQPLSGAGMAAGHTDPGTAVSAGTRGAVRTSSTAAPAS